MDKIEALKKIHYDLKAYYDVQDFSSANIYLRELYIKTEDTNKLFAALIISKSFRNRPEIKETLQHIEDMIELLTGKPVL